MVGHYFDMFLESSSLENSDFTLVVVPLLLVMIYGLNCVVFGQIFAALGVNMCPDFCPILVSF
jgi:hypothetical protein